MHFLCLHGIGTNSQACYFSESRFGSLPAPLPFSTSTNADCIFAAALRYELGDQHTYEFVEGTIPWPIAPEISNLFNPDGRYFSYFDPSSASSARDALQQLDEYIEAEGPFDGVLGFSLGACLAAMHIIRKVRQDPGNTRPPPFKCAIFLSTVLVHDPVAIESGEIKVLDPKEAGQPIQLPTVHIWGAKDPRKGDGELLKGLCDTRTATGFIHEGMHEVPGLGTKAAVTETVKAMRRGISKASITH
ncbi:Hydrolase FUB4 [Lachnellula arida]|uniref:Hydrolase FUB4 n=1 Tax=Lachnellula arida TaxID=1316785 RepID=A0A8T9BHM7_9HELO|nr:Hydrolase FUB4 [Lachnellula arida]